MEEKQKYGIAYEILRKISHAIGDELSHKDVTIEPFIFIDSESTATALLTENFGSGENIYFYGDLYLDLTADSTNYAEVRGKTVYKGVTQASFICTGLVDAAWSGMSKIPFEKKGILFNDLRLIANGTLSAKDCVAYFNGYRIKVNY